MQDLRKVEDPAVRRCGHCGRTLPEAEFYRDRTRRDGLDCYCKVCRKESNMRYTDAGQERRLARLMTDPEYRRRVSEYNKKYYRDRHK